LHLGARTAVTASLGLSALLWQPLVHSQELPTSAPVAAKEIRFRDFFRSPMGPRGPELSDALRAADQKEVRLVGYMVQQEVPTPGRFMLTPRPVQMSEHADGDANDLPANTVTVYLDASQKSWNVPHVRGLIAVDGVLSLHTAGATNDSMSWVRLQLKPEATRGMSSFELANYFHQLQHIH
jgi:hypothetical protein